MAGEQRILVPILEVLEVVLKELRDLRHDTNRILSQGETTLADLEALSAAVAENTNVDESAITLLNSLADELRAAATDPEAIAALADQLSGESSRLAAAVSANTPASPPVTPLPEPEPEAAPEAVQDPPAADATAEAAEASDVASAPADDGWTDPAPATEASPGE